MSLTSWPIKCPCWRCKGERFQCLAFVGPGQWLCPESGTVVVVNETMKDRAKRRHVEYLKGKR